MDLEFNLEIFNETDNDVSEYDSQIKKLLEFTLDKLKISGYIEACIIFVDNQKIKEINKDYRNKDYETDVISFAMEDMGEDEIEIIGSDLPRILGDIYISLDKCKSQSVEYNHSFVRELMFLSLHGFLHLLGYDHIDKDDEIIMTKLQEDILNENQITR